MRLDLTRREWWTQVEAREGLDNEERAALRVAVSALLHGDVNRPISQQVADRLQGKINTVRMNGKDYVLSFTPNEHDPQEGCISLVPVGGGDILDSALALMS